MQRAGSLAVLVMNINSGPIAGFQCWIIETGAIKGFQRLVGIAEGALIVALLPDGRGRAPDALTLSEKEM